MTILLTCLILSAGPARAADGVLKLNHRKTHVTVSAGIPHLEFRAARTRRVKILLNENGAFVDGKLACAWPNGRFDPKNEANMVLGFKTADPQPGADNAYAPCPTDLPIKSTWGDGGLGAAALYVEIEKMKGEVGEVRFRGETLTLDLTSLKGRYRVEPPGSLSNEPGG